MLRRSLGRIGAAPLAGEQIMNGLIDTCALCPRLCRHRCPVAVATGMESTTPTAIMTQLVLSRHHEDTHSKLAVDLCTRCGECEDACGVDQPVVQLLDEARTKLQPTPAPWQAPAIEGSGSNVAIICGEFDWSGKISKALGGPLARLVTTDHLGEAHRIRTDTRDDIARQLKALMMDKKAITSCHTCRIALEEAGADVVMLGSFLGEPGTSPRWRTCQCEPGPGVDTVVTCCGARAPLNTSHPELAQQMARSVKRRLDGQAVHIEDSRCSAHLRAVGANTTDPVYRLRELETPDANR